jgi:hypothetical protein
MEAQKSNFSIYWFKNTSGLDPDPDTPKRLVTNPDPQHCKNHTHTISLRAAFGGGGMEVSYISNATPTEPWSTDENRAMCPTLCSTPSTTLHTIP